MPSKRPLHAPTAYELRKKVVDLSAAQLTFERKFAQEAFELGALSRSNGEIKLTQRVDDLIDREGHTDLARSCLAYLLSTESGHERLEKTGFLVLVRQIRDAAETITLAANELTDQLVRHRRETGYNEELRAWALEVMAKALHSEWRPLVHWREFEHRTAPMPIDSPLADGQWTHGLMSCASLYNKADEILKDREIINQQMRHGGMSVMASGNRADHERDAFLRDLAEIYERVFERKASAREDKNGEPSPFMRFVHRVFKEIPATHDHVDPKRYRPPSSATVRAILQSRSG